MQTILGASGQIARELARELKHTYSAELRLVSRHPRKVNASDALMSADLLDARQTLEAVKGSRNDNLFDSSKFRRQFPDFRITSYRQGLEAIYAEWQRMPAMKQDK